MTDGRACSLPASPQYSIAVWFLNDGQGDQGRGYGQKIIDKTVMMHDFYLCVHSSGQLAFPASDARRGQGLTPGERDFRDGRWHHAVVVRDGAKGWLFVDGEEAARADGMVDVRTDGTLMVGTSRSPDGHQRRYWSGQLDELMLWTRALDATETRQLYTAGRRPGLLRRGP